MKTDRWFVLGALGLVVLSVYLFASAPPLLPESTAAAPDLPVERLFTIAQGENAAMRKLWTEQIVAAGKQRGLAFDEHWKQPGVDAGPLPALFLRETALRLEKSGSGLSLFLGSDAPISPANRFDGEQSVRFATLRSTGRPQFFYAPDIQRHTALFPDLAVAPACVDCHNGRTQSPRKDWKLGDIMGATTWLYPASGSSLAEATRVLSLLRTALRETYASYLRKAAGFAKVPTVGDCWPRDAYCLPTTDVFMAEFERRASTATLRSLLEQSRP